MHSPPWWISVWETQLRVACAVVVLVLWAGQDFLLQEIVSEFLLLL